MDELTAGQEDEEVEERVKGAGTRNGPGNRQSKSGTPTKDKNGSVMKVPIPIGYLSEWHEIMGAILFV